jgi:hypothetical protein
MIQSSGWTTRPRIAATITIKTAMRMSISTARSYPWVHQSKRGADEG